jgi:hypothetical protein
MRFWQRLRYIEREREGEAALLLGLTLIRPSSVKRKISSCSPESKTPGRSWGGGRILPGTPTWFPPLAQGLTLHQTLIEALSPAFDLR